MKKIGIKLADGSFYPILEEGEVKTRQLDLTTAHDKQKTVQVELYRSETGTMEDAEYVDTLVVKHLKAHPMEETELHLSVGLDENNELTAKVIDDETGKESEFSCQLVSKTLSENVFDPDVADSDFDSDFDTDSESKLEDDLTSEIESAVVSDEVSVDESLKDDTLDEPFSFDSIDTELPASSIEEDVLSDESFGTTDAVTDEEFADFTIDAAGSNEPTLKDPDDNEDTVVLPPLEEDADSVGEGLDLEEKSDPNDIFNENDDLINADTENSDIAGSDIVADDIAADDMTGTEIADDDILGKDFELPSFDNLDSESDGTESFETISELDSGSTPENSADESGFDDSFSLEDNNSDTDIDFGDLDSNISGIGDVTDSLETGSDLKNNPETEGLGSFFDDIKNEDFSTDGLDDFSTKTEPSKEEFDSNITGTDSVTDDIFDDDINFGDMETSGDSDFDDLEPREPSFHDKATPGSSMDFSNLYDEETLNAESEEESVRRKTRGPVIICIICAIICILATLLILFVVPSKYNLLGKFRTAKSVETTVVESSINEELAAEKARAEAAEKKAEEERLAREKAEKEAKEAFERAEAERLAKEEAERKAKEAAELMPVPPAPKKTVSEVEYKIKWGDTLWDISESYYKNPWKYKKIAKDNNIPNPDMIISGRKIKIKDEN